MKKIAVVLSGCGYLDGSEITESVSLIIELSKHSVQYDVFAPNKDAGVTAHFDEGLVTSPRRNCLEESSRISRGKIQPLSELSHKKYDGLAIPGGFGVAKTFPHGPWMEQPAL